MGRHSDTAAHPAGSDRATVAAIRSRIDSEKAAAMPVAWISPDEWAHQHAGTAAQR